MTTTLGASRRWARLDPYHGYKLSFEIDFNHPVIGRESFHFDFGHDSFLRKIILGLCSNSDGYLIGREDVIAFVVSTGRPDVRVARTEANGQPAVAWYVRETPAGPYVARSIEVLSFDGERVSAIVADVIATEWESPVMRQMMAPDEPR